MNMNFAICIIGPICSGKSTLAYRLVEEFNMPYLTETMFDNGLMGILDHLSMHQRVILEHCSLLEFYEHIAEHFKLIVTVYIEIADSLLRKHWEERINRGGRGDFEEIDPVQMKYELKIISSNCVISFAFTG